MLDILADALDGNNIKYRMLHASRKFEVSVLCLRFLSEIRLQYNQTSACFHFARVREINKLIFLQIFLVSICEIRDTKAGLHQLAHSVIL